MTIDRLDVARTRRDFPILNQMVHGKPLTYLDNAATSQKPLPVLDAMDLYYRETNSNIHRGVHALSQEATKLYDESRFKVQALLNAAESAEIIFTKGCTEAINLVAESWGRTNLREGDRILVSTMEHHSNIVPWQLMAQRTGAEVVPIPVTDSGEIDLEHYHALLDETVKLVAIVHVSNSLGTINPIKQMVAAAHQVGALAMVDGAQAGPHMLVDVQDLDADFYTLSCHKMYAPTGVGILYGKRALLEGMPPYQGGGDMIRTVRFSGSTYAPLPAKYEAGTPNIAGVIGLGAAIDYLASLSEATDLRSGLAASFAAISDHEIGMASKAEAALSDIKGVKIWGQAPEKAAVVSFTIDGAHPHDIGTILDMDGIAIRAGHHCCMPLMERYRIPATARASFALYNTAEEVDRLIQSVHKVKEMFA